MFLPTHILSVESWILLVSFLVLLKLYVNRKWKVLKQLGIPHDPPSLLDIGNSRTQLSEKIYTKELENKKKYGPIWGFYALISPRIVIHDLEIARQVCIKDFNIFPNRLEHGVQLNGKELHNGLLSVKDQQWKRARATLTPTFSSVKLRQMAGIMNWSVDNTLKVFQHKLDRNEGVFVAKNVFSRLSLDVICSAAFSTDVNSQDETKDEPLISKQANKLVRTGFTDFSNFLVFAFPCLESLFVWMSGMREHVVYLRQLSKHLIEERSKCTKSDRVDLLQLMLDAKISDSDIKAGAQKGLSEIEIVGNAMTMLFAGYETTGGAMTTLAYNLACHPRVQRKLQSEIDETFERNPGMELDDVNNMKYLDMCISESLRMYCPVGRVVRAAKNEVSIGGITIPRGCLVVFPVHAHCHDPEYWDDPMEFKPERMQNLSEIDPVVYMPFGMGPRHCIGQRFALLEMKLAFAKILHHFSFEPTNETPEPPLQMIPGIVNRPKVNFCLRVVPR